MEDGGSSSKVALKVKKLEHALINGAKPKSGKLRLNVPVTCFGGKINWFRPKNSGKRRAPDLENPK
jgi:hypothetical protein